MNSIQKSITGGIILLPFLLPNLVSASPVYNSLAKSWPTSTKLDLKSNKINACATINSALKTDVNCEISKTSNIKLNDFEKALQYGVIYASKFLPRLNSDNSVKTIGKQIQNDTTSLILALGSDYVNTKIQEIPFLSQTQVGIDFTSEADSIYYVNGLFKLANLGIDGDGNPKGILFAQGNIMGTSSSGITTNLGLGARKKLNSSSMLGLNAFWDYRMTSYSSAYSRWGAGAEVWWKDFKLTNNWYIAGTGIKRVTTSGQSYLNDDKLDAGTYSFSEWAGANTYDERVVPGWDLGLNYRLPSYPQLSLGLRGYRWDYLRRSDNTGVEGTVSWQATPRTNLTAWVSNEIPAYQTLSNTELNQKSSNTYYGLRFTIQLKPVIYSSGSQNYTQRLLTDMAQPVARKNEVLLERWKPGISKTINGFQNKASAI